MVVEENHVEYFTFYHKMRRISYSVHEGVRFMVVPPSEPSLAPVLLPDGSSAASMDAAMRYLNTQTRNAIRDVSGLLNTTVSTNTLDDVRRLFSILHGLKNMWTHYWSPNLTYPVVQTPSTFFHRIVEQNGRPMQNMLQQTAPDHSAIQQHLDSIKDVLLTAFDQMLTLVLKEDVSSSCFAEPGGGAPMLDD